jgi:hypothetical protein
MNILLKAAAYCIVIGLADILSSKPVDIGTLVHIFLFATMLLILRDSDGN